MPSKTTWTVVSYGLMFIGLIAVSIRTASLTEAYESVLLGVAGTAMFLLGLAVGIRYGNHIRYHSRYNPETGAIDASTPYAWVANKVRGSDYKIRSPERLTHTKKHAFVRGHLTLFSVLTFGLALVDVSVLFHAAAALIAILGGVATVMWTQTAEEITKETTQLDELEE